jgi:hypothetical protein
MADIQATVIRFPADLHVWLRVHALENRTSLNSVVVDACEQLRQQQEANQP